MLPYATMGIGNGHFPMKGTLIIFFMRKGGKFQNFHHFWTSGAIPKTYTHYFIVDDDIIIQTASINRLFMIAEQYRFWLCAPAFDPNAESSVISHRITKAVKGSFLRYTSFVEVNVPLFSRDALDICMKIYPDSLTGWGIDILFCLVLLHYESSMPVDQRIAIIDQITCINPKREGQREICRLQPTRARINAWNMIQSRLKLRSLKVGVFKHVHEPATKE